MFVLVIANLGGVNTRQNYPQAVDWVLTNQETGFGTKLEISELAISTYS